MNAFTPEIEQEVLGALITGAQFPSVSMIADIEHFLHPAHKRIFDACKTAHERTGSCKTAFAYIDKEALTSELSNENIKAGEYLAHIAANVTFGTKNITQSAKKVVEQWARLAVAEELDALSEAAKDPASDIKTIVSRAGSSLDEIMADVRGGVNRKSRFNLTEASQNALEAAKLARERGSGLTGMDWGLNDVNRLTGGLQRRDLTLMAARPSMGKTTVAMSCALSMARKGHAIGMISLEMDADKVGARMTTDFAYDSGIKIPYSELIKGSVGERDLNDLIDASKGLHNLPLLIEDQSNLTMSAIRVKLEAMMEQCSAAGNPLSTLIVDHIGLIKSSGRYSGNRVNEIAEISSGLKEIAREYDIAVLALSQLNRGVEQRTDKRPILSDLRDSGALEQDADTIIFLYREAYYIDRNKEDYPDEAERLALLMEKQNSLEFIIAKQRNGPIATVELHANMATSAIRNAA